MSLSCHGSTPLTMTLCHSERSRRVSAAEELIPQLSVTHRACHAAGCVAHAVRTIVIGAETRVAVAAAIIRIVIVLIRGVRIDTCAVVVSHRDTLAILVPHAAVAAVTTWIVIRGALAGHQVTTGIETTNIGAV